MIRDSVRIFLFTIAAAAAVLMNSCGGSEVIALTGGSEVIGKLVKEDNTPVAGIEVRAVIITLADSAELRYDTVVVKSVYTSPTGSFQFDSLRDTLYTLDALYPADSLVLPAITFRPDSTKRIDLSTIIMKVPGSISGTVQLIGSQSNITILCYLAGTSFMATVNPATGQFTISGVPSDTSYTLTIAANGYLTDTLGSLRVDPGITTIIPEILQLKVDPDGDIPVPSGITLQFDTLSGTLNASWDAVNVSDVHRYIVFTSDSALEKQDTVSTTTFSLKVFTEPGDSLEKTIRFQVAALDDAKNSSQRSTPDSLTVPPPSWLGFAIHFITSVPSPSVDSLLVIVEIKGKLRPATAISWWVDHPDSVIRLKSVDKFFIGTDTLVWQKQSGKKYLGVTLTDNTGMKWSDSIDAQTLHPVDVWVPADSLIEERRFAGACVVNGTIVVFGGCKEKSTMSGVGTAGLKTAEKFDPSTGWTKIADMQFARYNAAFTECNGKIYIFGGNSGTSNQSIAETTVEEYDPQNDTWKVVDTMEHSLIGAAACCFNGKIIVSGGMTGSSDSSYIQSAIYEFDPANHSWKSLGTMNSPRLRHSTIAVGDQGILVFGGSSETTIEPVRTSECILTSSPAGICLAPPVLSNGSYNIGIGTANGKIVIFGGLTSGDVDETPLNSVDIYTIEDGGHVSGKPMPFNSQGMAVVTFNNGIYSIGGSVNGTSRQQSTKAVYVYYP